MIDEVDQDTPELSIILPAKNEAAGLRQLLPRLREQLPQAEIIIVDDGSTDDTVELCRQYSVTVVQHKYSMGNGAAIKAGARQAHGEILVFMDADGQHDPGDIPRLLDRIREGFDMVVGARTSSGQASIWRGFANRIYNTLASWITGHRVDDLTSGFRAVRAKYFQQFLYLLPNGFSYPTTITMAFFRAGYAVGYEPIDVARREGKSHIRPLRDGVRFFLIIFRVGTLYSPLKVFLPVSVTFFLVGLGHYIYTYATEGRFTNMSMLLFTASVVIFLIGLISEQIANLMYASTELRQVPRRRDTTL